MTERLNPEDPKADVPDRPMSSDDPNAPIQLSVPNSERGSEEARLIGDLIKEFETWEAWRRPYELLWMECYRLYMCAITNLTTPTRSKTFIPATFQVIEAAVPKLMNIVFGGPELFDVIPENVKELPLANIIKKLLTHQLRQANFFFKFMDFAKQLLMYGTSYFKVYWKVVRRWVWTRVPIRKDVTVMGFKLGSRIVGWNEKKEYRVVERRPELEVIDVLDVFPDPEAQDEQLCRAVWIRSWMDIEDVREAGKGQFPVFDPTNSQRSDLVPTNKTMYDTRRWRRDVRGVTSGSNLATAKQCEILERWGLYDLDGDGIREECLFAICNRSIILRAIPNPFHHQKRPIVKTVLFGIPLEWYGVGMIEPIIPLQHELNTLRRQRMDNVGMAINRMWKVNSYADIDLDTLVSSPNGIILTDDMAAVEPIAPQNVTDAAYTEAAIVQTDIENTTSPKSIQGSPTSGALGRTARGAQMIIGQALEKFGTIAKLIEETGIKKVLRLFHQLNLQFIDDDEVFQETGMYGTIFDQQVKAEDIRINVQFEMKAMSEIVGTEGKINQMIAFLGMFGKFLSPETVVAMAKKVWNMMGFDPKDINMQAAPAAPAMPGQGQPSGNPGDLQSIVNQVQANGASAPQATAPING